MSAVPGTGSPEAIAAAVKLLDAGRGALLDGRQVSALTQAKVALAGFASAEQLALVEDTRAEFRVWVKDVLALDAVADPSCKLEITTLVGCYEAAKARFGKRLVTEAEASSSRLPKVVPRLEHLELRAKFEKLKYRLEEALNPPKALLESLFESIEEGELRNLALKDLVSVEEAEDFDDLLAGFDRSGTLRLKRGTKEVPVPVNSEGLRRRLKLLGHLCMMCKIRYAAAMRPGPGDLACPGWCRCGFPCAIVEGHEFGPCMCYFYPRCRRPLPRPRDLHQNFTEHRSPGLHLKQGETAIRKPMEARRPEHYYHTTSKAAFQAGCLAEVQEVCNGSWAPSRPLAVVSGKGSQVSQEKQKKGKGKGVKGDKNWNAPDGREECFAFNGEGCSNRNFSRRQVCRRCFGCHTQANCQVLAASAASSPAPASASASASAADAPKRAKGAKGAGG